MTYIALQLSIGLCVDYAAHIGHTFLTLEQGSRNERALNTVLTIGTAVIYGGFSTFLALSILAFAKTYSYRAFFQVNALIIFFGLFHGVVLLPIILSIMAPNDKPQAVHEEEMEEINNFTSCNKDIKMYHQNGHAKMMNGKAKNMTQETIKLNNEH